MGLFAAPPVTSVPASAETTTRSNPGPPEERTLSRGLASAARTLNDAGYAGANREVTYSIDAGTHVPVIKVVDSQTKEVITQWPPEYLLQLASEVKARTRDSG